MHGANGSARRRSHRRGPPYRDSAIAAPTHNYFSLNSPVSGHSPSPPGSPGRQGPSSSLVRQLHKEQILCRVAMGASAAYAPRNGSLSTNGQNWRRFDANLLSIPTLAHRYIWCCLQSNRQSSCQRHHSVSINFRFRQLVRL